MIRNVGARQQVRSLSIFVKLTPAVLGVVAFVTLSCTPRNESQTRHTPSPGDGKAPQSAEIPMCSGAPAASSDGHTPSQVNPHPHSVTLSWNAAIPATRSPLDAIKGYYVYRSLASHRYRERDRISDSIVLGTRCIDTAVEPRKTYFYVVKAVTTGGKQSKSSLEIKAAVPFP
jgi:hypothetical protein